MRSKLFILAALLLCFGIVGLSLGQGQEPPPSPIDVPVWNRAILDVVLTPIVGTKSAEFNITATVGFEIAAVGREGIDLSAEIIFVLNGVSLMLVPQSIVIEPDSGIGCGEATCGGSACGIAGLGTHAIDLFCRESDVCDDGPTSCDCRCGSSIVIQGPRGQPLTLEDQIMVLLRPAPGTLPEEFRDDDLLFTHLVTRQSGADYDGDGAFTILDVAHFTTCMTGPEDHRIDPDCRPGDLTDTGTIDLWDFAKAQNGFDLLLPPCQIGSVKFYWPMPGVDGRHWVINNYVDLIPGTNNGLLDFMGNSGSSAKTYEGHRGIDVDVPTFRSMDNDFPIVAGAPGYVDFVRDSEFDRNMSCTGTWNVVVVKHANGFKSYYGHLKRNSVVVSEGDWVVAGQKLGVVGSSGCSTAPHLHFEVHDCDDNVVAPFLEGMFINPPVYDTPLNFMDASLRNDKVINSSNQIKNPPPNVTLMQPGDTLSVGMSLAGGESGDTTTFTIKRPNGSTFSTMTWNMGQVYRHSFWWNDRTISESNIPLGFWKGEVRTNGALKKTFTFGVSTVSPNFFQQVRHDVSNSNYQSEFNNITAAGYRPVWVDGFDIFGTPRFNAIFDRSSVGPWRARHNMSGASYQNFVNEFEPQGYRITHVDSYRDGNSIRYAAIMVKDGGPQWSAYHGKTVAQHQALFNTITGLGFRPVNISVVELSGTLYITALYDKKNVGGWIASAGLTSAQYQQAFTNNTNAGRRLAYLDGYTQGGVAKFSAIWDSTVYSDWVARHDKTKAQFQSEFNTWSGQGFATRIVTGYQNGSVANFGGFWIKN